MDHVPRKASQGSGGVVSKRCLLQGSSKGGLGSFAEEKALPQQFDSANSRPVGRGVAFLEPNTKGLCVGRCHWCQGSGQSWWVQKATVCPHLGPAPFAAPSCQQDHGAFPASPGSPRLAGAEQGCRRAVVRTPGTWPQGLVLSAREQRIAEAR